MQSIVAIDLETTGLDPRRDSIIEIGAVRFNENGIQDEYQTFINPGKPIPPFITQLTGIKNEQVVNAPDIRSAIPELVVFVDKSPILGQNLGFDLGFLRKYAVFTENPTIDTFDIASVVLPQARRYNLGALGVELGIPLDDELHRAVNDARLTARVYQKLFERIMDPENGLSTDLLREILHLSKSRTWDGRLPFEWAFQQKMKAGIVPRKSGNMDIYGLFEKSGMPLPPLKPVETITPLDVDEAAAILEGDGAFSKYFNGYEHRSEQVAMLKKVAQSFNDQAHLFVEAGTGTGKSFAYLIPAVLWATQNQSRVIISTNTINLQEQLISKDIPDLKAATGIDFRASVLKGKGNYLCPRRLEAARMRPPSSEEELRVLAKIMVWLNQGGSGDRTEINLTGPDERDAWNRLSADDEGCSMENCIKRTGGACPFYKARMAAQSAHVIVVNHALLLADIATGSRVLPEYQYLVIDEGHHLEDATTNALSFRVTQYELDRMLRELGGSSTGVLGRYLNVIYKVVQPSELAQQEKAIKQSTDSAARLQNNAIQFFRSIDEFIKLQSSGRQVVQYSQQIRVIPAVRAQPDWTEVEMAWDELNETFKVLLLRLVEIHQWIGEKFKEPGDDLLDVQANLGTLIRRFTDVQRNVNGLVSAPSSDQIYWVEINNTGTQLSLNAAPLHIGSLMEKHLWLQKSSIIVTSATLTAAGDFSYIRGRLNAEDADELAVDSPFDYENSALLYLVNDIPEPTTGQPYQAELNNTLVRLAKQTHGRMLVLFTNYSQLKQTSNYLNPILAEKGITVYEQGEGASAASLLESFKSNEKSVLLGTRSFWEGVDIPGQSLSVVVITKVPFDVPSDPIIAARSETFDDPFNEYSLPEAILRFRQGFGRLIRNKSDRGAVVILDRRILTKKYGRMFIDSLPHCTQRSGSSLDLPKTVEKWLNEG